VRRVAFEGEPAGNQAHRRRSDDIDGEDAEWKLKPGQAHDPGIEQVTKNAADADEDNQ